MSAPHSRGLRFRLVRGRSAFLSGCNPRSVMARRRAGRSVVVALLSLPLCSAGASDLDAVRVRSIPAGPRVLHGHAWLTAGVANRPYGRPRRPGLTRGRITTPATIRADG